MAAVSGVVVRAGMEPETFKFGAEASKRENAEAVEAVDPNLALFSSVR